MGPKEKIVLKPYKQALNQAVTMTSAFFVRLVLADALPKPIFDPLTLWSGGGGSADQNPVTKGFSWTTLLAWVSFAVPSPFGILARFLAACYDKSEKSCNWFTAWWLHGAWERKRLMLEDSFYLQLPDAAERAYALLDSSAERRARSQSAQTADEKTGHQRCASTCANARQGIQSDEAWQFS